MLTNNKMIPKYKKGGKSSKPKMKESWMEESKEIHFGSKPKMMGGKKAKNKIKKYQTAGVSEEETAEETTEKTVPATTTVAPAAEAPKDQFYELANKLAESSPRNARKALKKATKVEIARATGTRVGSKAGETLAGAGAAMSGAANLVSSVKPGQQRTGGAKSMEPGGGGRFDKMVAGLKKKGKSEESAKAIAASAGRKKYGKSRFQEMAAAGRRKKEEGGFEDEEMEMEMEMETTESSMRPKKRKRPQKRKKIDASGDARRRGDRARGNQKRGRTGCYSGSCAESMPEV